MRLQAIQRVTVSCFVLAVFHSLLIPQNVIPSVGNGKEKTDQYTSVVFPHLPDILGSHRYKEIEPFSNGEAFIYEAGKNNPMSIILIHGLGDEASRIWGHLVSELAEQYHVVTFDLPGFGRSSKQNFLYSPKYYADFVQWAVQRYVKGKPHTVLGHSLGGGVALCYAALYPENLRRLILVDASGVIHRQALSQHIVRNMSKKHEGITKLSTKLFGEIMRHSLGSLESNSSSEWVDKILHSEDLRIKILDGNSQKIAGLALANFDFSTLLAQIRVPAFIIWGADDPITPLRTGKILTHSIEKTKLTVIPDTGHIPILEKAAFFSSLLQEALVTEAWQSPWTHPQKTNRVLTLSHKHNITITGYYKSITLSHCGNITLQDVETEFLHISHCDEVVIENSTINGKEVALKTSGSRIQMTGVRLTGETAMLVSGCIIDLAAVKINGQKAAVQANNGSKLLFSVSKITSPFNTGYIHGSYEVTRGSPL